MATKQPKQTTIASVLYKGSYNIFVALEQTPEYIITDVSEMSPSANIFKVVSQIEMLAKQKPFLSVRRNDKEDSITLSLLQTEQGKTNFQKLLSISKKVFEPTLKW